LSDDRHIVIGSFCGRCLVEIALADIAQFLADDHLCQDCAGTSDSEHAQSILRAERSSTNPLLPKEVANGDASF
jgi:hypothetical protein